MTSRRWQERVAGGTVDGRGSAPTPPPTDLTRRRRVIAGTIAMAVTLALSALMQSPSFRVEQVVLTRAGDYERVSSTTLESVASVVGQSIFTISSSRVAEQVAALPGVRRARVIPHLPNMVEIEVEERLPIVIWRTFVGDVLVDDQGFVVATVTPSDGSGTTLPIVVDTSGAVVRPGDMLPARAVLAVGAIGAAFEAARLPVEAIEYGATGLSFVIDGGTRVVMGEPEMLSAKFGHMLAVRALAQTQGVRLTTLDVRAPTRPSYRAAAATAARPRS